LLRSGNSRRSWRGGDFLALWKQKGESTWKSNEDWGAIRLLREPRSDKIFSRGWAQTVRKKLQKNRSRYEEQGSSSRSTRKRFQPGYGSPGEGGKVDGPLERQEKVKKGEGSGKQCQVCRQRQETGVRVETTREMSAEEGSDRTESS